MRATAKIRNYVFGALIPLLLVFVSEKASAVSPTKESPGVRIRKQVIYVELARTPQEWQKGLMYRERLSPFEGMLFWGEVERPQSFWMKNTLISLDIIFISRGKKIVSISKRAMPMSEDLLKSSAPAQYVLEVLGGQSDKFKWEPGDSVEFLNMRP